MMRVLRFWSRFALLLVATACASDEPRRRAESRPAVPTASATTAAKTKPTESAVQGMYDDAGREPVLTVTDPEALAAIAREGGDFARLALGLPDATSSNAELGQSPAYRSLAEVIEREISELAQRDPRAGVGIRGHAHRLFDVRWLHAASARFELVAVTNRIDRRALDPRACGETRFVYRLAYQRDEGEVRLASRLPMTFALELRAPDDGGDRCRSAAKRWLARRGVRGAELGRWLTSAQGPLARERLSAEQRLQLSVNLQSVRWPSAVRPDLGGHAEYVLRAFSWDPSAQLYRPRKLENTPDVPRLLRDPKLRAELRDWIAAPENLRGLDAGTALLPEQFLAESIVSVTPRGLARRQNRGFRRLLSPGDFAELPLRPLRFARSPEALLRRLDDLTCNGCHQSRSIAGFHLVGEDVDAVPGNALASALSAHASGDLPRRKAYLLALATGTAVDEARPFAERAHDDPGGYGAHCGLGDPGFASWTCAPGLRCDPYEAAAGEQTVGVCLPERASVGDPCEPSRVQAHDDPKRERAPRAARTSCDQVCEATAVGFPGGMCASSCDPLPSDGACGGIAILTDFNNCLARREPFARCVANHVRPAGLRACSASTPCRDDYICARTAAGGGACLPPYFVFQLRVDGHP